MDIHQLHKEVKYTAFASSGPGGQHANKVATKVMLEWKVEESLAFAEAEHQRILYKLHNRLTKNGVLQLSSQESRSQATNKELVFKRFVKLINQVLIIPKARKKRTLPRSVKRKRLND
ncbi:peptide chain release factor-like protein, partial [Nonlabens sp.]|uniref:peptide chain release factor-like protein n=1 Tax=Nonlabens sp. TaxID=1888209 RepID=UPI003F6A5046